MGEYLFRGKRRDNGEWIEGSLIIYDWDNDYVSIYSTEEEMAFQVDPETVGQWTGLTDNDGTKIFEGDILARYSQYLEKWLIEGVVKYGEFNCSCCNGVYGWFVDNGDIRLLEELCVKGNIYDNPELLGGEMDD